MIHHHQLCGTKIEFFPAKTIRHNESTAEWSNARLNDEFGCTAIRIKGDTELMAHPMFGILALSADQLMRLRQCLPGFL
jgi:hypothetical protein